MVALASLIRHKRRRSKPQSSLTQLLEELNEEQLQLFEANVRAATHDRRHYTADPRTTGRTKRRRKFGKKHKKYKGK